MRAMSLAMLCASLVSGAALPAAAADMASVLRGSSYNFDEPVRAYQPAAEIGYRWDGMYVGGQVGRSWSTATFGQSTSSLLSYILRNDVVYNSVQNWTVLPDSRASSTNYGGFVGYNTSWEDAMLGVEINYNRLNNSMAAADSMTRVFNDDTAAAAGHHYFYTTTVAGGSSVRLTDVMTFRGRVGWEAGPILPYAFGGLAVARADVVRSATVRYRRDDVPDAGTVADPTFNFGPVTQTETSNGKFIFGWAAGLGVDVAILPNVFLRGEWEYVQFMPVSGTKVNVNSVRTGLALKF